MYIENAYKDVMGHYPTENQKFGIELPVGFLLGQMTASGIKMAIVKSAGGRNLAPRPFVSEINQVTGNKPLALEWAGDVKGLAKSTKLLAFYKLNKDLPRNLLRERLGGYYEYQSPENIKLQKHAENLLLRDKSGIKNQAVDYKSDKYTAHLNKQSIDLAVNKAVQKTLGHQPVVQGGYSEAVALRLKEACHELYSMPRQEARIIASEGSIVKIKDIKRITQTYGGSQNDWVKLSSKKINFNKGSLIPGRKIDIELHWYENIKTGKKLNQNR